MNLTDFVVFSLLLVVFISVGETVFRTLKKDYLRNKARVLREIIIQKNNEDNPDKEFYSCVFDKWDSGEKDIHKASEACKLKN